MMVSMNVSHFVKICQVLTILHQLISRGVANFGTRCTLVCHNAHCHWVQIYIMCCQSYMHKNKYYLLVTTNLKFPASLTAMTNHYHHDYNRTQLLVIPLVCLLLFFAFLYLEYDFTVNKINKYTRQNYYKSQNSVVYFNR